VGRAHALNSTWRRPCIGRVHDMLLHQSWMHKSNGGVNLSRSWISRGDNEKRFHSWLAWVDAGSFEPQLRKASLLRYHGFQARITRGIPH